MLAADSLSTFLGGFPIVGQAQSDFELIEVIREGLPAQAISHVVAASGLSEEEIFKALRIAKRTAARRKASDSRLKASESELIYRFSKVMVTATEVLGTRDKARQWVLTENIALAGNRPIDLLDTGIGFGDVMDELQRIEHGVYS